MGPAAWVGLCYCACLGPNGSPLPPHTERITWVNHAYGAVALCVNPLWKGCQVKPLFCDKKSILLRRVHILKCLLPSLIYKITFDNLKYSPNKEYSDFTIVKNYIIGFFVDLIIIFPSYSKYSANSKLSKVEYSLTVRSLKSTVIGNSAHPETEFSPKHHAF